MLVALGFISPNNQPHIIYTLRSGYFLGIFRISPFKDSRTLGGVKQLGKLHPFKAWEISLCEASPRSQIIATSLQTVAFLKGKP